MSRETLGDLFDVMVFGRYPAGRLEIVYSDLPRPTMPELESLIDLEWVRRKADADRTGGMLFNGSLFRYLAHDVRSAGTSNADNDRLTLTVGPTCYRDFVGTNLYNHHRLDEFGWERFANPIGTTATLTTADGRIAYGRRSPRVAYHASHVHTFGGAFEAEDRDSTGHIDGFGSVQRELTEELNLRAEDMTPLEAVGVVRDREIRQPELLFEARARMTFDELKARWESAAARDEHAELVWLPERADAIVPFIQSCDLIAPVAVAALMLFGRARWGEAWYESACRSPRRV